MRLRVAWPTEYEGLGNSFGYAVHNEEARRAAVRAGIEPDPEAPLALHVAPAHLFRPLPGKHNILYTAWESTDLTPSFRDGLMRADAVIVTASFLLDAVRRAAPGRPVYLCHLGVDAGSFPFKMRRPPPAGRPFRFLWVGAPNARKGWQVVREAWRMFVSLGAMGVRLPKAELYLKTTVTDRFERIDLPGARIIFDSRRLPRGELARLYGSAHAFLFPSFGEGFGLTLAEAMATGLPALFTDWSAMRDFADRSTGFPLKYELARCELDPDRGVSATFARVSPSELLKRMIEVMRDYRRATLKGRRAARRIREEFTWDRTGSRLASIIRRENERRRRCPNKSWRSSRSSSAT